MVVITEMIQIIAMTVVVGEIVEAKVEEVRMCEIWERKIKGEIGIGNATPKITEIMVYWIPDRIIGKMAEVEEGE